MRAISYMISALALTTVTVGFAYAETAKEAILARDAAFVKAYNAKDAVTVASIYSEDGAALPTNDVRADGRAAIQKMWQGGIDYGYTALTLTTKEVQEAGDWAYAVGVFTDKYPDKNNKITEEVGKYVEVWQKAKDGKWYLYRDIWNNDPAKTQ